VRDDTELGPSHLGRTPGLDDDAHLLPTASRGLLEFGRGKKHSLMGLPRTRVPSRLWAFNATTGCLTALKLDEPVPVTLHKKIP
jgi:hypothetical protein